jgi:hypothetical protein
VGGLAGFSTIIIFASLKVVILVKQNFLVVKA